FGTQGIHRTGRAARHIGKFGRGRDLRRENHRCTTRRFLGGCFLRLRGRVLLGPSSTGSTDAPRKPRRKDQGRRAGRSRRRAAPSPPARTRNTAGRTPTSAFLSKHVLKAPNHRYDAAAEHLTPRRTRKV